ncbi:MAG: hypothetical protein HQM16_07920 [Deltaproteobacteria bacterium]|nr:hypothetical protein [Deltaproteobacteria bacterium]
MFKKTLVGFVVLGVVAFVGTAQAQYCGGTIVSDNDCDSNTGRPYSTSCCPDGYRAQGVAYNDMAGSDEADAISPICRSITAGNDMMPTDFQTTPVSHLCDNTEVMSGIACKDMPLQGAQADYLDGCTAVCFNPTTKQTRTLHSEDLGGNTGRSYVTHTVELPNRVFGIAYKDSNNGTGKSDVADCATIVYRNEPVVGQ